MTEQQWYAPLQWEFRIPYAARDLPSLPSSAYVDNNSGKSRVVEGMKDILSHSSNAFGS